MNIFLLFTSYIFTPLSFGVSNLGACKSARYGPEDVVSRSPIGCPARSPLDDAINF